jgi:uncharacterized protein DUF5335
MTTRRIGTGFLTLYRNCSRANRSKSRSPRSLWAIRWRRSGCPYWVSSTIQRTILSKWRSMVVHMIPKPREIYVDDGRGGLMSIEVVDAEGTKQIIILRDPLMLPPPAN